MVATMTATTVARLPAKAARRALREESGVARGEHSSSARSCGLGRLSPWPEATPSVSSGGKDRGQSQVLAALGGGRWVCGMASAEESYTLELTEENVETVLDEVRPYLMADGGNVELLEIDGLTVRVKLQVSGWRLARRRFRSASY
mmetsp:Transcript_9580/g.27327  ORF Transcript_9580/g.27327 Transcript_9580/m.27327 type:complete len:146 (-) Transcript_9580:1445-1882(-)